MNLRSIRMAAFAFIAGCAAHHAPNPTPATPAPKAATEKTCSPRITEGLLDRLAMLATNAPRDVKKYPSPTTEADLGAYIDALVEDPRFAEVVAPNILLGKILQRVASDQVSVLSVDQSRGVPVYYTRKKCDPARAESVHPWWALDTVVKVCPEAHQPDHLKASATGLYCGFTTDPYCGCGPNLAFCARDADQNEAIIDSLRKEVTALITRVVATGAPVDEIFLSNETARDRNVEYVYRRWRISAGEPAAKVLADLATWPETPVYTPRHESTPHQHAGVLTMAGTAGIETSRRARMKWFYDAMWCDEPPGGTVTTDAVMALPPGNLRLGDGWQQLAAMPICTNCHARLDYGAQFFTGFGLAFAYDPKDHVDGHGKLFGRDISDYRGDEELTPRGFAKLALAQPEFPACIVRDVKRHVLVDALDASDDADLQRVFDEKHSLKALMRAALRRYAERERAADCARPQTGEAGGEPLDAMLKTHCSTCHGPSRQPDFALARDPATAQRALVQVAFGAMPKAPMAMTTEARERMVELLVRRAWSDPAAQAQARHYFEESRALPVHSLKALLSKVDSLAGAHPKGPSFDYAAEHKTRPDLLRYSTGVAATIRLEALQACKTAGHKGAELTKCIEHATDASDAIRTTTAH